MPEVAKNDDISVLPLSNRTQNRLRRAQVHTIGAMLEYPDTELLKLYNMGKKGVEEVRHWVDVLRNGIDGYTLISWREKLPPPPIQLQSLLPIPALQRQKPPFWTAMVP